MQGNPLGCRLFRQDLVGPLCNSMQLFQEAGGMEWAAKQGGGRLSGHGRNALDEANLYLYKNVEIAGLVANARSRSLHFVVCPCCFTSDDGHCLFQRGLLFMQPQGLTQSNMCAPAASI